MRTLGAHFAETIGVNTYPTSNWASNWVADTNDIVEGNIKLFHSPGQAPY